MQNLKVQVHWYVMCSLFETICYVLLGCSCVKYRLDAMDRLWSAILL
jgi:hypothetical protein